MRNLTKRFPPSRGGEDLTLSVPEGAALALVGASGASKSAMLRMIADHSRAGLRRRAACWVWNPRPGGKTEVKDIGYVCDNPALPGAARRFCALSRGYRLLHIRTGYAASSSAARSARSVDASARRRACPRHAREACCWWVRSPITRSYSCSMSR